MTAFAAAPALSARSVARQTAFVSAFTPALRARPAAVRRARVLASPRMAAEASAETAAAAPAEETFEFQAEVSRVMNLIINSLYSNKDIFLRELVSNASDACDKKRFLSLSSGGTDSSLQIRVKADTEAGTVTVEDSGIGMTRAELINNLGSIATSGTSKFAAALGENGSGDVNLIGQFGVGFYSAYLVADSVEVVTRSYTDPNAKQYKWASTASNSFTISEDDSEPLEGGSGTRIVLHIKDENKEFLDNVRLNELMRRYSEFIQFPVYGWTSRTEFDEVPDGDEKDADGSPKMKRVPRTVEEWSQINKLKPLWMRRPKEVEAKEYEEFYKTLSKDYAEPLAHTHFAVEGDVEFRALLFCPKILPPALRQNMFTDEGRMLKLYVKRVFISDNFEDILPRWLCFLRGVVDSEDLPLNVSREILQKSRVLRTISKRLVRKAIDMFKSIKSRDNNDYVDFWNQFGRYVKAGIVEGKDHIDDLVKLSLWASTNDTEKLTDLDSYVSRMKENQKDIYYVAADSRVAGESAPAMERLRKLGYEVLFLLEPVDEIAFQNTSAFSAKRNPDDKEETKFRFVDAAKDDLDFGELKSEDEKKEDEALAEDFKPVVDYFMSLLSNKIGKVQVSERLTESASTITQSSFGISPTMERYMKEVGAADMNDPGMASFMVKARTLEINPKHPIVKDVKTQLEGAGGGNEDQLKQTCMLVYELALLTGGYPLDDNAIFARRVSSLVSSSIEAPEVVIPEPEAPAPSAPDGTGEVDQEAMRRDIEAKMRDAELSLGDLEKKAGEELQSESEGAQATPGGDQTSPDDEQEIKSVKSEIVE